ncbi:MAG: hypothetical protein ACJASZ_001416 [Yoonia sp.]
MYFFAIPYLLHSKHCSEETGTKTGQDQTVGGYIGFIALSDIVPVLAMALLIAIFLSLSLLFGILMTLPIGPAGMPVVISVFHRAGRGARGLQPAKSSADDCGYGRGCGRPDADISDGKGD